MSSDIEKLYQNLNRLLEDICTFLSDDDKLDKLSPKDRKMADLLITRSKVQLQEISKVTTTLDENYGAYVDMEQKRDSPIEARQDNSTYSSVDDAEEHHEPQIIETTAYKDLPAKDLSHDTKFGDLHWKTKFIYFNTNKRVFAGIHHNWLLIYYNEKDLKPILCLDLKYHDAKAIVQYNNNNKSSREAFCFAVCHISDDKKIYQFLAQTQKDMLQWIANINKCNSTTIVSDKLAHINADDPPLDDENEHYDLIINTSPPQMNNNENIYEEEEENIYICIEDTIAPERKLPKVTLPNPRDSPPDLPSRPPIISQPTLQREPSAESMVSYDQVVITRNSTTTTDESFSDVDEEDVIYDQFVAVKENDLKTIGQLLKRQSATGSYAINDKVAESEASVIKPMVKEKPAVLPKRIVMKRIEEMNLKHKT